MTRSAEHPVRILPSPFACIAASACIALSACASLPMSSTPATVDFIVVRHAEKETGADVGQDPALTAAGRVRAAAIAQALADAPVAAVYSTDYARTRETALPTARAHGLEVVTYDAREPAETLAARLRASHATGTVLVVGHSNTVPAIATTRRRSYSVSSIAGTSHRHNAAAIAGTVLLCPTTSTVPVACEPRSRAASVSAGSRAS